MPVTILKQQLDAFGTSHKMISTPIDPGQPEKTCGECAHFEVCRLVHQFEGIGRMKLEFACGHFLRSNKREGVRLEIDGDPNG